MFRHLQHRSASITCMDVLRHGIAPVSRSHPAYRFLSDTVGGRMRVPVLRCPSTLGRMRQTPSSPCIPATIVAVQHRYFPYACGAWNFGA